MTAEGIEEQRYTTEMGGGKCCFEEAAEEGTDDEHHYVGRKLPIPMQVNYCENVIVKMFWLCDIMTAFYVSLPTIATAS